MHQLAICRRVAPNDLVGDVTGAYGTFLGVVFVVGEALVDGGGNGDGEELHVVVEGGGTAGGKM
jgi:hypothetical protein